MKMQNAAGSPIGGMARWPILVSTILTVAVLLMPEARAQGGDAEKLLKAMSDYVAGQKAGVGHVRLRHRSGYLQSGENPVHECGPGATQSV